MRPRVASVQELPGLRTTYTTSPIDTTTDAMRKKVAPAGATPNAAPEFLTLVMLTRLPITCTSVPNGTSAVTRLLVILSATKTTTATTANRIRPVVRTR